MRPQWLNAANWFAYPELRTIVQPHAGVEAPKPPVGWPAPDRSSTGRSR
jgi:hypothetical protein